MPPADFSRKWSNKEEMNKMHTQHINDNEMRWVELLSFSKYYPGYFNVRNFAPFTPAEIRLNLRVI